MIQTKDLSGKFVLDARGLDALRLQAKQDPQQALKGVSQQFEAVFLHTLLKTMREATPQDGPMDSDQTRSYTAMLDQQMAQSLSSRGIGLADVMLRQLTRSRVAVPDAESARQATRAPAPGANPVASAARVVAGELKVEDLRHGEDFLARMKEAALQASVATGIPARFLLGQAALESGWGKHEIRAADGSPSHNLFGIKAGKNWKGASVEVMTTEYLDGAPRKILQRFRAYGSYAEAFQDYAALLNGNRRYAAVLRQTDGAAFAQGLQRAGYATDPRYADKLTSILNGARMRRTIMA
jgi:flagellar protein FlgJ